MALTPPFLPPTERPDSAYASIWHAPLVPVALAMTAGILADRQFGVPLTWAWIALGVGLIGWAVGLHRSTTAGLPFLWIALFAIGALHHRQFRSVYAADDIGRIATVEPRLVRLRGQLAEEPSSSGPARLDPLRSVPHADSSRSVLEVTHLQERDEWRKVSGRVRLVVAGPLDGLHVGDVIEVIGWVSILGEPANPGEWDPAGHYLDDRITAILSIHKTSEGIVRLNEGWTGSLSGWLAVVRGWGRRTLESTLPPDQSGVAAALLLGDTAALNSAEWDKYVRTGVVHALAISGQHLVVLAAFLWIMLRICGVSRKRGAWIVGLVLIAYALLTGGRPPAMRSAVMVALVCGGLIMRRIVLPANGFALAWLVVVLLQPTDVADTGCLLSFFCVLVLIWGVARWFRTRPMDPLEKLIDSSRPGWLRGLRWLGRWLFISYAITLVLGLTVTPLVAYRYHLVSPIGFLIGPPVVLLTSTALVFGFLLLFVSAVMPPLAPPFAWAADWSLRLCGWAVNAADQAPGGHWYIGNVPGWWVTVFYAGLMVTLLFPRVRAHWRSIALAGLAWLIVGLAAIAHRSPPDGLRVTFLAVGHGGCTVIEAPDGRVLLYDAGALAGPDVTRRQIAPYLWYRNIRRIDEVFISHADLDHFNGLPSLLDRFPIGQVSLTPTFADKSTPGVRETVTAMNHAGIRTRIVKADDRFSAGDVTFDVLHPPAVGPEGVENARSLVLLVTHDGHSLLLTGDLEAAGLDHVLAMPRRPIDVLMAPHHGGRTANPPTLAEWCRPRLVVACQGPPPWPTQVPGMYESFGATYFGTWPNGAVTIMSHRTGLVAETFRTGKRIVVRAGAGK